MFIRYNPNSTSSRVDDCSVRALCKALGQEWDETYLQMCIYGLLVRNMPSGNAVWGKLLSDRGFKKGLLPNSCHDCYTMRDFQRDYPKGTYVVAMNNHVATVVSGNLYDSWDSSDETPLYYWKKEE